MTLPLPSKPGISGASTLSIPKSWDPVWFRGFVTNVLKGADVRNAVGANGVTVTGTLASPYATITGTGGFPTPAAQGDLVYYNGTAWVALAPGTAGQFLETQGAGANPLWAAASGGATGANPTAKVELTAVNGTATTFMRSDGSPPIDQSIAPLWTGLHTFAHNGNNCIQAQGDTTYPPIACYSGGIYTTDAGNTYLSYAMNASGAHYGAIWNSGASTFALGYSNSYLLVSSATAVLTWTGAGGVQIGAPTGGDEGVGSLNLAGGLYINGGQLFFGVPNSSSTTAAVTDVGKMIVATGNIAINNSVFSEGHALSIYNNSGSAITINGTITTMRLAGTATTGNRTLAQRGIATLWFLSSSEVAVGGAGVT